MKQSEANILICPDKGGLDKDHWQSRWLKGLKKAQLVEQENWKKPELDAWKETLLEKIHTTERPIVLVGHGLGVLAVAKASERLQHGKVVAGFLVSPPNFENKKLMKKLGSGFEETTTDPLPFPSLLIASRNNIDCDYAAAEEFAYAWGSRIIDAGEAGKINSISGHGPWPEGLMTFGQFLVNIKA